MPITRVGDIEMHHLQGGSGAHLVLIGGLGLDVSEYRGLAERFARHYRVLAFDNRGAGLTDKPTPGSHGRGSRCSTAGTCSA
jgi:3-oxoadipate enol-lactonase